MAVLIREDEKTFEYEGDNYRIGWFNHWNLTVEESVTITTIQGESIDLQPGRYTTHPCQLAGENGKPIKADIAFLLYDNQYLISQNDLPKGCRLSS